MALPTDETPPRETPAVDPTVITAAVVTVVGLVASLTAAGAMQRILRNQGELLSFALAAVAFGGYCLFRAALLPKHRSTAHAGWWHNPVDLRKRGGALIGLGALGAVVATVLTSLATERPAISASLDPATGHVKATITAGDLGTDDSVKVTVDGLKQVPDKRHPHQFTWQVTQLSQDASGPDANGAITLQVDLPIPAGDYDHLGIRAWTRQRPNCTNVRDTPAADQAADTAGAACVIIQLPVARPTLTAAWEGTGADKQSVKVTLGAANVGSHVLVVDVAVRAKSGSGRGSSGGTPKRVQYRVIGPGAASQVAATLRVPIPANAARVCAAAHLAAAPPGKRPPPACPAAAKTLAALGSASAYAELAK